MKFSILSERMIENNNIRKIVNSINRYKSIFTLEQQKSFDKEFSIATRLTLKDYDRLNDSGSIYDVMENSIIDDWNVLQYWYVLPIIRFKEIEEKSQIISSDKDTQSIQYGRGLTSRVSTNKALQKINMDILLDKIVETNRKITIFLSKEGNKTQLQVFKNQQTGKEYVFMKKKDDGTFDDSIDINATFIGIISPLTWTVDKKSGFAICSNPLFLSERSGCEYEKSALSKFLESDEFVKELGMNQEKKSIFNNPFGYKKEKLSLEEKINRLLAGGRRIPYLVGHPGIGKTQIAKSINENCLAYNLGTFTPDAFTGKTSIIPGDKIITKDGNKTIEHNEKGKTTTTEPEWHTKLVEMSNKCLENNKRCVLLLDEFDKLTPNMQIFINGIVDTPRTIAGWEIPNNVDIILAGNTEEYSDASFKISGEVASRLIKIEVKAVAIDWLKWASKHKIDPLIKAYIHCFPNKIIQDIKDKNGEYDYGLSLSPRHWDEKINDEIINCRKFNKIPFLEPVMDKKNREEFEEFYKMYFEELGIEEILKGNTTIDVFDLTHDRIQIIINCLIAAAATEEEITNALIFIKKNHLNEYKALFEKRWMDINDTDDDILKLKLAKNNLGERSLHYGK
ncbi:MAG: AAA family ATPase [Bacilli bacterium]|nr:AAA family ATPase [Bacilli bacterium]